MTAEGWGILVARVIAKVNGGDCEAALGIIEQLADYDKAKTILRDKGYGITGQTLSEVSAEVLPEHSRNLIALPSACHKCVHNRRA